MKKRKKNLRDQKGKIQIVAHKIRKSKMVGMMGKNLGIEPDPNPLVVLFLWSNGQKVNVILIKQAAPSPPSVMPGLKIFASNVDTRPIRVKIAKYIQKILQFLPLAKPV